MGLISIIKKFVSDVKVQRDSIFIKQFPEFDGQGRKTLVLLEDVHLTGVTKDKNGINPQEIIKYKQTNEQVFFERVQMEKYPYATLVVDRHSKPLGWIPEASLNQKSIAKKLDEGITVLGRVHDVYGGDNGKYYGISIDIARYASKKG